MKPRKPNRSKIAAIFFGAGLVLLSFVFYKLASSIMHDVIKYLHDISSEHAILISAIIIALAITNRKGNKQ
ncbi:MAG: hypothetical protein EOM20_16590 [Spartobacteria bacterium]|nr:hypothetical protein [Spartobacteria bacterium]